MRITALYPPNLPETSPSNLRFIELERPVQQMREEVLVGLRASPKRVSPKYFYDATGSRLFERICKLPEYYLTRAEFSILRQNAIAMMRKIGTELCVIEPGAGACEKVWPLLRTGAVATFIPIDICEAPLYGAATQLARSFPDIGIHAVSMDFVRQLDWIDGDLPTNQKRLLFYPGSSIGNFEPEEGHELLKQFHDLVRPGGALLIGFDLQKDAEILRRAYDDSQDVTAAFNLNLLTRFNKELGADFDLRTFRHMAVYNSALGRIEMHLVSLVAQEVTVSGERVFFRAFEKLHTENCYKFTTSQFDAAAANAGFRLVQGWSDTANCVALRCYEAL